MAGKQKEQGRLKYLVFPSQSGCRVVARLGIPKNRILGKGQPTVSVSPPIGVGKRKADQLLSESRIPDRKNKEWGMGRNLYINTVRGATHSPRNKEGTEKAILVLSLMKKKEWGRERND